MQRGKEAEKEKKQFRSLLLASLFLCFSLTFSQKDALGWSIDQYEVNIQISEDRKITVEEKITANFTADPHHGIYRFIPLRSVTRYAHAHRLRTRFLEAKSSKPDDQYWVSYKQGQLFVKIGNPRVYRQESVPYTLRYTVDNVISNFPTHDELYWNATGNEWNTLIKKARVNISFPKDVKDEHLKYTAFAGGFGATDTASILIRRSASKTVSYEVSRPLSPYEGITIVLGLGKGILEAPSKAKKWRWFFEDNWPYGICFLMLLFLIFRWWRRGKDPSGRGSITVAYEPPAHLTPAEAGTLIDEKADLRDITANLIDLAVRGHLIIQEKEDDFVFVKTSSKTFDVLKPHEILLMDALFSSSNTQTLSSLKNKFYVHIKPIQKSIYQELIKNHYFPHAPQNVRMAYRISGLLPMIMGFVLFCIGMNKPQFASYFPPLPFLISGFICGFFLILFAPFMPRKTRQGVLAFEQIKGLEEYIARAEKETIQKVDVKREFERLLPYAMCLGLTKSWVQTFRDLYKIPPQWYSSASSTWNMIYFSQSLNRMERSSKEVFTSVPRTSGSGHSGFSGGYSGGGSGGGGGGAW